jgi:hypothetical protein
MKWFVREVVPRFPGMLGAGQFAILGEQQSRLTRGIPVSVRS